MGIQEHWRSFKKGCKHHRSGADTRGSEWLGANGYQVFPENIVESPRWWFQSFLFSLLPGFSWSNLTTAHIFQMGWFNHQLDVSENSCIPKSSILIGFSIINHPFRGTTILGNHQLDSCWCVFLAQQQKLGTHWVAATSPMEAEFFFTGDAWWFSQDCTKWLSDFFLKWLETLVVV